MDPLSDALRVAHLSGGVFLNAEFTSPWCMESRLNPARCVPALTGAVNMVLYHYVVEGEIRIRLDGDDGLGIIVTAGEAVLLPRNDLHYMGSDLTMPAIDGNDLVRPPDGDGLFSINHGGGGPGARMICGFLGGHGADGNPLLAALPPLMTISLRDQGADEWIQATFRYAAQEVAGGRAGSATVLARLSELLFVEAVRRYVESLPDSETGWLAGLRDPQIAKTLALIHNDPAHAWTVDELGRGIGLSRSALADRFTRLIGHSPIQYLIRWRMQVAAQMLIGSGAALARVAEAVGYDSEAAFSRAFKKEFGSAPGTWRQMNHG